MCLTLSNFRQLNIIGSRRKEPLDDEITLEEPVLLRRALNMIVDSARRPDEIFEDLKIPQEDIRMLAGLDKSFFAREQNIIPLRLKDKNVG